MREKSYVIGVSLLLAGVVLPSILAAGAQGAGTQQYPAYAYPQTMQTYHQPMHYAYPTAAYYYPQMMQGQPMTAMPYAYPGMQMQPQRQMIQGQQPQFVGQYRSPYNPNIPATPGPKPPPKPQPEKVVKPWGDTRYIWPDFYTDFTGDFWDEMINTPNQMGYMPGGWRFPSFSSPDPVTVGDAVANQMPPIMDEGANFIDFAN